MALSPGAGSLYYARLWRRLRAAFVSAMQAGQALPRSFGSFLLGVFFSVVLLFGILYGGHGESALKMVTASLGLAVEEIEMSGLVHTSEIDILEAIDLDGDSAMLAFDVARAHEKIMELPWVRSVVLRKIYPNQLHIAIVERQPMALWQHYGRLDIIDETGQTIMPFTAGLVNHLPLLVGRGAEVHGMQMLAVMERFGDFKSRIRAYRRVADRRWDLVLDNGIELKLPQRQFEERLAQFLERDSGADLLERDVLSIDLRLEDRMSVTLSDTAMARWRGQAGRG